MSAPFWRLPLCLLQLCPHRTANDAIGIWGECIYCGHRAGFVSRAELSAYADREFAREQAARSTPTAAPAEDPTQRKEKAK